MNILYVENHSVFAKNVVSKFLTEHKVTVVPNLSGANQAVSHEAFDLFLVDYDLDDGKGDEFVRALRSSGNPSIVIAVSSHNEGNSALLAAGATAVCSKMNFDEIQIVINSLMKPHGKKRRSEN